MSAYHWFPAACQSPEFIFPCTPASGYCLTSQPLIQVILIWIRFSCY